MARHRRRAAFAAKGVVDSDDVENDDGDRRGRRRGWRRGDSANAPAFFFGTSREKIPPPQPARSTS